MNIERDKGLSKQGQKNYDDIEWNSKKPPRKTAFGCAPIKIAGESFKPFGDEPPEGFTDALIYHVAAHDAGVEIEWNSKKDELLKNVRAVNNELEMNLVTLLDREPDEA